MTRALNISAKLLLSISVVALAACGSGGSPAKTAAPMPPVAEMDAAMTQPAPQPLSTSDTLTPVMPSATSTTTTVTTTAAPAAATGYAPGSVEERIAKLEQTVGSLRSDYDRIMPAFASLNTTNDRIQTLLDEIERETGHKPVVALEPAVVAPTSPATEPAVVTTVTTTKTPDTVKTTTVKTEIAKTETPAPVAAAEPASASATGANVTGVRIGEHGNKTRFVIDLTGKSKPDFKYDLDNGEKLLLVDLPSTGWTGKQSGKGGAGAPLVEGWSVQKGASGGSSLAVQLKKNARILSTQFLPAEGKDPARLVMDIAAGN